MRLSLLRQQFSHWCLLQQFRDLSDLMTLRIGSSRQALPITTREKICMYHANVTALGFVYGL